MASTAKTPLFGRDRVVVTNPRFVPWVARGSRAHVRFYRVRSRGRVASPCRVMHPLEEQSAKRESGVALRPRNLLGRDAALARIGALLVAGERVTVVGLPGAGKTALVNAAVRDLQGSFQPVWDMPGRRLAQPTEPSLLVADVSRRAQVEVDALSSIIDEWHGPVLVAGPTALGTRSERVVPLSSLGAPEEFSALASHPAARLWRATVRAARSDTFPLSTAKDAQLLALLQRLDGFPAAVVISADLYPACSLAEQLGLLGTIWDPIGLRLARLFRRDWEQLCDARRSLLLHALAGDGIAVGHPQICHSPATIEHVVDLHQRGFLRRRPGRSLQLPAPAALAIRHLASAWEAPTSARDTGMRAVLDVGPECMWLEDGNGHRADLRRRATSRALLQRLVLAHEIRRGAVVPLKALIQAGWPEQRVVTQSSLNRLRVAICRLRQMGLRESVLVTTDGYLLDPNLDIRRADPHAA